MNHKPTSLVVTAMVAAMVMTGIAAMATPQLALAGLVAGYVLILLLGQQPLLFNLFMNIILVIGLTYFAMPLLSRLLRRWLYPKNL
jgi:antibiotic biosynthesis monooxygenase (ABM) superfamily enzyme